MSKLTITRLRDYPKKSVESVEENGTVLGLIEKQDGVACYKAFSGSGFLCRYLSTHRSRQAAANAILLGPL